MHRGHLTKQGSTLVRWAAVEAVQHAPENTPMRAHKDRIEARRGTQARNIAKAAAARKLLTLVSYGLRDGEVRCLARTDQREQHPDPRPTRDRPEVWPPHGEAELLIGPVGRVPNHTVPHAVDRPVAADR
ncbi:hypothetical protein AB0I54_43940 [Streptomyces sp. NPDC050625]|uniref:hypothetical protein n=1 Tax=Streptomyces sp. NPDC050625 TaxID=3154629 RepID=UPI0034180986